MKFVIESDGTLQGTTVEFKICVDEIPRMISRALQPQEQQPEPPIVRRRVPRTPQYIVPVPCQEYGEN